MGLRIMGTSHAGPLSTVFQPHLERNNQNQRQDVDLQNIAQISGASCYG